MPSTYTVLLAASLAIASSVAAPSYADQPLPQPQKIHIAAGMSAPRAQELLMPARRYYAFWNTGDEQYAKAALAGEFMDLNLPDGRPQGPQGPIVASRTFRKAVPDLALAVPEAWVIDDQVLARLTFTGHFTGEFAGHPGDGREIRFEAIDMYTIRDGHIVANRHLEDNLTLLKQLGIVSLQ